MKMKLRATILAIIAAGSLAMTPAWAQRAHGSPGSHWSPGGHGGHGYDHSWGPFGFLLGTAILYSALQPRTVYYEPQVVYTPPPYAPATTFVQPYYAEQSYVSPPVVSTPPPPRIAQSTPLETAGVAWWYFCKKPAGYYPYIRECPSGWERVSPTPPGVVKP